MAIEEIVDALELSGIKYQRTGSQIYLPRWEGGEMWIVQDDMTGFLAVTQRWPREQADGEMQTATSEYTSRSVESWFNF